MSRAFPLPAVEAQDDADAPVADQAELGAPPAALAGDAVADDGRSPAAPAPTGDAPPTAVGAPVAAVAGDGAAAAGDGAAPAVATGAERVSETTGLAELAGPSHAVAVAAGQAAADCAREIERSIEEERRRAEAGWQAGAGWSPLTGGRAAALRTRLAELGERRERLVASLAEQATAVDEHTRAAIEHTQEAADHAEEAAAARRELYGLIAALSALADEAAAPTPHAPDNGAGETPPTPRLQA